MKINIYHFMINLVHIICNHVLAEDATTGLQRNAVQVNTENEWFRFIRSCHQNRKCGNLNRLLFYRGLHAEFLKSACQSAARLFFIGLGKSYPSVIVPRRRLQFHWCCLFVIQETVFTKYAPSVRILMDGHLHALKIIKWKQISVISINNYDDLRIV